MLLDRRLAGCRRWVTDSGFAEIDVKDVIPTITKALIARKPRV